MKYIFGDEVRAEIVAKLDARFVVGLDFDGTLAPIVADPRAAAVDDATRDALARLARNAPVAIISGRATADVRSLVRLHTIDYYGNHGLEGGPGWPGPADEYRRLTARWHTRVERSLGPELAIHRIFIENKDYSLALHFRRSRDREAAVEALLAAIATLEPAPRIVPGKAVVNLVPADAPTKGDALRLFAERHDAQLAVFAGDDETDEDAFRVMGLDVLAIRVGGSTSSAARYCVRGQREMRDLLELLARCAEKRVEA